MFDPEISEISLVASMSPTPIARFTGQITGSDADPGANVKNLSSVLGSGFQRRALSCFGIGRHVVELGKRGTGPEDISGKPRDIGVRVGCGQCHGGGPQLREVSVTKAVADPAGLDRKRSPQLREAVSARMGYGETPFTALPELRSQSLRGVSSMLRCEIFLAASMSSAPIGRFHGPIARFDDFPGSPVTLLSFNLDKGETACRTEAPA